jgi:hypothetical protein
MTNTGSPFPTPQGEAPPTGRKAIVDAVEVATVTDGKISKLYIYFDQVNMLGQLGLLPAPAGG